MVGREWSWKTADEQELASRLQAERAEAGAAGEGAAEECETGGNTALIGIRSGFKLKDRPVPWKASVLANTEAGGKTFEQTGYFRTAHDGSNWWFVDPDGFALFSAGMDCIGPASPMRIAGMEHLLPELPTPEEGYGDAWTRGERISASRLPI